MAPTGEERAWKILGDLEPSIVSKNAGVSYDINTSMYKLKSLGADFLISLHAREITHTSSYGELILQRYSYFFNLSALCYLINAKDIPLTGKLIKPTDTKGGDLFFRGTHELPLDRLVEKFGSDKSGFLEKAKSLGGKPLSYGDASVELLPMPRIPVALILWLADDEFPARADLLLDSTCEQHLPLDIIWSIAMLSVLVML